MHPSNPAHGAVSSTCDSGHSQSVTPRRAMLAGMAGIAAGALLTRGAKAGPLDPPAGPVTSTGKTLLEVEPRIAINQANTPGDAVSTHRITQPGSYYLTGNIIGQSGRAAIGIAADNVTIDLMGFSLTGVPGATRGIDTIGLRQNITIRRGVIEQWPEHGVRLTNNNTQNNSLVEDLILSSNGDGIRVSNGAVISRCVVRGSGNGIVCAFGCVISHCVSDQNNGGILSGSRSIVTACSTSNNTDNGITTGTHCVVSSCTMFQNAGAGIQVGHQNLIQNNICNNNGTPGGIWLTGGRNRIVGNSCSENVRGIHAGAGGNFIAQNTCAFNTFHNWDIAAGNVCLVINAAASGAFAGSAGGVSPGSTDPNANYSY